MSIQSFYNSTAILEIFTEVQDDYGQQVKTWSVSTYIIGCKQNRSGNKSIQNFQDQINKNDIFYCNMMTISEKNRLIFTSNTFSFLGSCTSSTQLVSTIANALYFATNTFSTYSQADYITNSSTGYKKANVEYRNILNINKDLRNHHLQIELEVDNEHRT